ncbi:hypothetical protein [Winogradskyella sp.]|uniref:hypothetical protein n=1 Tax=Winogradskyella sp. TaxID=1883156 RepID=UPI00261115FE|nr:hypothetical protein [Winogradskyella sp.]
MKKAFLCMLLIAFAICNAQSNCDCIAELEFVIDYYQKNLPGFKDNVSAKKLEEYQIFKNQLLEQSNTTTYLTAITQDSTLVNLIAEQHKTFKSLEDSFEGEGWNFIVDELQKSKHVLVGEDHFSNEIPQFIKAVFDKKHFDNFYIEVDPYSTKILERSLKEFTLEERQIFNINFSDRFSFYSFKAEYDLLKYISDKGTNILGADQIIGNADLIIFNDLISKTESTEAKKLYRIISKDSENALNQFYEKTKNPMTMHLFSDKFTEQLNALEALGLSHYELEIFSAMRKSVKIYKEQNHYYRVKLILNQLMKDYPQWKDSPTLFKYGATHLTRGESQLGNYDIGNLVANITESNFEETFHIMVVGESGQLGSIFKIFPPRTVDKENDFYLSYLKPFFEQTDDSQWHVFNLRPLRKQILRAKLKIDNLNLERVIRGYDALVIIPEVTAAKLIKS